MVQGAQVYIHLIMWSCVLSGFNSPESREPIKNVLFLRRCANHSSGKFSILLFFFLFNVY